MVLRQGRTDYIVVVLLGDVPHKELTEELKVYLKTHTYIDAREYANDIELIRKRIRFALPKVPLKQLKVIIHSKSFFFVAPREKISCTENPLSGAKPGFEYLWAAHLYTR